MTGRVLKISDAWQWFAEAEQLLLNARALLSLGWHVDVACQPESPLWGRAKEIGAELHPLPGMRGLNPLSRPANVLRIAALVRTLQPDVVHAYRSPPHALSALALSLLEEPPPLIRSRGAAQRIKAHPLNTWLYRGADAVIASSGRVAQDLHRIGVMASRVHILRGAIDVTQVQGGSRENFDQRHKIDGRLRIGLLGRVAQVKGHRYALQALKILRQQGLDVQLLCAGEPWPEVQAQVDEQVRRLALQEHVRFLGRIDDVADFLAAVDVGLIASVGSETIARALLEEMAAGCAVVATQVGVIPEIMDQDCGIMVPPRDRQAMAAALRRLLDDAPRRRAMGLAGQQKVAARFSLPLLAAELSQIYAGVRR